LDLAGDSGATLARTVAPAPTVRHLDTVKLGAHLRELAESLRNGHSAPELERATGLPAAALERLLTHLYVQWCSAGSGRADERQGNATRAHIGLGMHAAHFQISGRAFRQPGSRYTREEERDLATFGHITERTEQRLLTGRSAALEPWEIVNQSVSGLLGLRRKADLERSIAIGELVAMRVNSIDPPGLGVIQRLKWDADGSVSVGLRLLRGEARGVAVRAAGNAAQSYERALLMDAGSESGAPPTLIVSAGRYAAGTKLELHTGRAEEVLLEQLVERSVDFDRYTFARL
jgi:hypothetical protein